MNDLYTSIVLTHWAMNPFRSELMRRSLQSLLESVSHLPVELIVVNNSPENREDHEFFNELLIRGKIVTYLVNQNNMGFGFARNQGLAMANGNYFCIVDNDLIYKRGWLDECLEVLVKYPDKKIYTTPIDYPTPVMKQRYDQGFLGKYQLNMRAGSNCFVVRKEDFMKIGWFRNHRIAGTVWTDSAVKAGYLAAILPGNLVEDQGLRKGYNLGVAEPIKRRLLNKQEVYLNQDEYPISSK